MSVSSAPGVQREVREAVVRRRDAAAFAILRYKEENADHLLPAEVQAGLRRMVLRELHELTDVCLEALAAAGDEGSVVNGAWLEQIASRVEDLHRHVVGGC